MVYLAEAMLAAHPLFCYGTSYRVLVGVLLLYQKI